ncbi:MAG: hypothetical protein K0R71_1792 [Bacillales bacterium]|nr:hypothetical protein [Bacillales bacterium]
MKENFTLNKYSLTLIVVILFSAIFIVGNNYSGMMQKKISKNDNVIGNPINEQLNKSFDIDSQNTLKRLKKDYPNSFGGLFIDENSILTLCIVKGEKTLNIQELESAGFHIKYVEYPIKHLYSIIDNLTPKMERLKITSLELDEKNNRVNIYFKNLSSKKIANVKKYVESNAVNFKESLGEITY